MAATPDAVLLAPGVPMIELVVGPEDDNLLRRFAASDLGHQVDTIDRLDLVLLLNLVSHGFEGVPDMVGSHVPLAGSPEMAIADVERQRVDMVLQPVTGGLLRPVERFEGSAVACARHPEHATSGDQQCQREHLPEVNPEHQARRRAEALERGDLPKSLRDRHVRTGLDL